MCTSRCLWYLSLVAALLIIVACGSKQQPATTELPEPYAGYCTLMKQRCSRCHEMERIEGYRAPTPQAWDFLVFRMKHHRGSGISFDDAENIVQCLVYRDFGDEGLKALGESK